MEEKRRAEIASIVEQFKGTAVTDNLLKAHCERQKIEPVTVGEFEDYTVQVEHDAKLANIFGEILKKVQKLRIIPEFASVKLRKEIKDSNNEIEIDIAKLFEAEGIRYNFVSGASEELARVLHAVVSGAGTRIFNKATSALLGIAKEKYGGEFTTAHSASYYEELYKKEGGKEEEKEVK